MSKKSTRPLSRNAKINALLRRKLIAPARFSNEMVGQHRLRAAQRNDALGMPRPDGDVETGDWWETAGEHIQKNDPELKRAGALLHELMTT